MPREPRTRHPLQHRSDERIPAVHEHHRALCDVTPLRCHGRRKSCNACDILRPGAPPAFLSAAVEQRLKLHRPLQKQRAHALRAAKFMGGQRHRIRPRSRPPVCRKAQGQRDRGLNRIEVDQRPHRMSALHHRSDVLHGSDIRVRRAHRNERRLRRQLPHLHASRRVDVRVVDREAMHALQVGDRLRHCGMLNARRHNPAPAWVRQRQTEDA
ncbi:hypothetical protein AZH47_09240 [Corynebacterium striatum]|nr:hypothetical protein AZH47_09240 [Corynebacterium striatum]